MIKQDFIKALERNINAPDPLIQVILGPRQVGKTTGIKLLLAELSDTPQLYTSADADVPLPASWLHEQWARAAQIAPKTLLVVDEIQRVENWSSALKTLWDSSDPQNRMKIVVLGSSSLNIQQGLNESLAGRFQIIPALHWNYLDSKAAYGLSLEEYLIFGGYPGSYRFRHDLDAWLDYLTHSIIQPVIGKDILQNQRVKSPALFKQLFDLACSYPAQEISYTKLLGQLQAKGNTDLVKHYLELLEGAFLVRQIFKYSNRKISSRSSSPKILPLCPALYAVTLAGQMDATERGRALELAVGAALSTLPGELFYWREKDHEVDFIYTYGKSKWAIEVKSGRKRSQHGLGVFLQKHPRFKTATVDANLLEKNTRSFFDPSLP